MTDTPEICRMRTAIILMKLCFATGVLAIPSAFEEVGYGPGIILLFVWGAMCTCKPAAKPTPPPLTPLKCITKADWISVRLCSHNVSVPHETSRSPQHRRRCGSRGRSDCTGGRFRLVLVNLGVSLVQPKSLITYATRIIYKKLI